MVSRLKTQQQVAEANLRARRFDPAAYTTQREGSVWFAFGPDGGIYQFRRGGAPGEVELVSSSGMGYRIAVDEAEGRFRCSCPDHQDRGRDCKHMTAWEAIRMAARMAR